MENLVSQPRRTLWHVCPGKTLITSPSTLPCQSTDPSTAKDGSFIWLLSKLVGVEVDSRSIDGQICLAGIEMETLGLK